MPPHSADCMNAAGPALGRASAVWAGARGLQIQIAVRYKCCSEPKPRKAARYAERAEEEEGGRKTPRFFAKIFTTVCPKA